MPKRYQIAEKADWLKGRVKEIGSFHETTQFSIEMPIIDVRDAYSKPEITKCTCKNHTIHGMKSGKLCAYTEAVLKSLKQPVEE